MPRWMFAVLALVAFPVAAQAQFDMTGPLSPGVAPSFLGYDALSLVLKDDLEEEASGKAAADQGALDSVPTSFTPSRALRAANLAAFVEKSRRINPQGAAELQRFVSGDIIGEIDGLMRQQYGMRANDVADAFAVWWTTAWIGSRGKTDTPTRQQIAGARQQAARALALEPGFRSASDAEKQEYAEALLIQAAMNEAMVSAAQGDPATLKTVTAAIAQGARDSGVDLEIMTLTDDGFAASED